MLPNSAHYTQLINLTSSAHHFDPSSNPSKSHRHMPAPHIVIQHVLLIGRFFHYALLTFVYARIQAISQLAVAVHAISLDLRNKDAVRPPAAIRGSHGNSDYNLRWRYRETVVGGSSEYLEAVLQSHRRQRIAAAASDPSMCSKMHT